MEIENESLCCAAISSGQAYQTRKKYPNLEYTNFRNAVFRDYYAIMKKMDS
jgi:hypothetical protein